MSCPYGNNRLIKIFSYPIIKKYLKFFSGGEEMYSSVLSRYNYGISVSMGIFISLLASNSLAATVSSGVVNTSAGSAQNLVLSTPGATASTNISYGFFVSESYNGSFASISRAIMLFDTSAFSALDAGGLTGASIGFNLGTNWIDAGETFQTELRMFGTSYGILDNSNRDALAAISGDGGAYSVVEAIIYNSASTGLQTVTFDAADLAALAAILTSSSNIGFAFKDPLLSTNDILDGIAIIPSSVSLSIDGAEAPAVPLPAGLPLLASGLGAIGLLGWRRKRTKGSLHVEA